LCRGSVSAGPRPHVTERRPVRPPTRRAQQTLTAPALARRPRIAE
jgi:hypothetical protein